MAGKVVDPLGSLEIRPAHGFRQLEISRAGADEGGHVSAAADQLAEVVAVGADIKPFGAVNAEADNRQSNFQNLVPVDPHFAGRAVDDFALPRQFIEGNPVFLDGGDHGRDLVEFAGKFSESRLDGGAVEGRNGLGFENLAGGVLGIGGFAKLEGPLVLFVLGHKQILNPGSFPNDEHQKSGGNRVERPAVAHLTLVEAASDKVDDIVGSFAGGFVDEQ